MATNITLHPVQSQILLVLQQNTSVRFSDLNTWELSSDHFNFHVSQLLNEDLITKNSYGTYELTDIGKEFANRFDTETATYEKQAKQCVVIIPMKGTGESEMVLAQQRLKQPYYGYYGFVSGKTRWGETILESAERELIEESGLVGQLSLFGIEHKMDYNEQGILLDDKYFYLFKAVNCTGELKHKFDSGENHWITKVDMLKLDNLFEDVAQLLELLANNNVEFIENKFVVKGF